MMTPCEDLPNVCRVLLVDDEAMVRRATAQWLELSGFEVTALADAESALQRIERNFSGVLVTDVRMPGMDGLALMQAVLAIDPDIPVVLITGHGDVAMAVQSIRDGAYDFIEKPSTSEHLTDTIRRACEKRCLVLENRKLKHALENQQGAAKFLLGNSQAIDHLRMDLEILATTRADVLILGETGAGKGMVARTLHEISHRAGEPFVSINCGAIPETMFESELFGHESGAFTGAQDQRIGRFEFANGGTIFLDEIESMPMDMQVKLLKVIEDREVFRLGSNRAIPLDVRVVAATKVDLQEAAEQGTFRLDLYYRLNIAELHIPPLRQRREDILLLFEYFLAGNLKKDQANLPTLTSEDQSALLLHDWPGNVRELKNVADRFSLGLSAHRNMKALLGNTAGTVENVVDGMGLADQVARFEQALIEQALVKTNGNIGLVMNDLDLPRRTLNKKMERYQLLRKNYVE